MKPLKNIEVIEFSGLGPGPFAAMALADMGAKVTRISRMPAAGTIPKPGQGSFLNRGRQEIHLDLKTDAGVAQACALVQKADALIEGFRPGKMESLGLGPDRLMALNPRLVYGRMTGWGQSGPMAHLAGHDLNFLALSGVLNTLGEADRPPMPPLNLIGDFGGGGMYLAFGMLSALWQARETGQGAVVDAAMIHGVTHLASFVHGKRAQGAWMDQRESNLVDGGAPFYRCYETRDGRYMAVGAIEPVFFRTLLRVLDLEDRFADCQSDRTRWPDMAAAFRAAFAARDLADWSARFDGVDACVTPVLTLDEAQNHPQMAACFVDREGGPEPAPAPRLLSRSDAS
ncbi:CaiB/BaiF CoA transferase family protein [Celeribacter neptunius]|uniref:Alpha-methylacyl-CoA racemase n=1 Tax=Celeribacter neptunius TaxID=588602 RepID=A0A1I3XV19_9RHOB|nr:CaiB/BaiF CoA-transferase family protein [Celeribacter neptunius]SFK23370.1 alpha-methylacyl-CoA racemase [Celeribacter neptunius]